MTVMVPSCMWIVVAWLALWLNRSSHHHLVFDQVQKLFIPNSDIILYIYNIYIYI